MKPELENIVNSDSRLEKKIFLFLSHYVCIMGTKNAEFDDDFKSVEKSLIHRKNTC
jgi:hypothetical protein